MGNDIIHMAEKKKYLNFKETFFPRFFRCNVWCQYNTLCTVSSLYSKLGKKVVPTCFQEAQVEASSNPLVLGNSSITSSQTGSGPEATLPAQNFPKSRELLHKTAARCPQLSVTKSPKCATRFYKQWNLEENTRPPFLFIME